MKQRASLSKGDCRGVAENESGAYLVCPEIQDREALG
jgi:hypothetical protein